MNSSYPTSRSEFLELYNEKGFGYKFSSQQTAVALAVGLFVLQFLIFDFSWLLGYAKITYYHAQHGILLHKKNGSQTSLSELCKRQTPPCRLNPLLFNGHLQTFWAALSHKGPTVNYRRKVFYADDPRFPGSFAVDFTVSTPGEADSTLPERTSYFSEQELESLGTDDRKPMLIALHGLSGGSYEVYLRQILGPLTKDHDWEACVVNSRGCANSHVTSSVLYNARATWDMRQTVKWIRRNFPNRPLYGIGFSIGANMMTNYVAEEGPDCHLKAAVVCSNPWNLDICANALQRTKIGREVYSRFMCENMKNIVKRNKSDFLKSTDIDIEEFENAKYLHEFDRVVQCPTWGYPTEGAYYRDASSIDPLLAVQIPLVAMNAEDDPICPAEAVPYEAFKRNPYAVLISTSHGGHLSWYQPGNKQWFATAAVQILAEHARTVTDESLDSRSQPVEKISHDNGAYNPLRRHLYVNLPTDKGQPPRQ